MPGRGCRECKNAYNRKWAKSNPDKTRESRKTWSVSNTHKTKEYYKEYYRVNSAKKKASNKEWARANPNKTRGYHLRRQYGITSDAVENIRIDQSNCCKICRETFSVKPKSMHIDHDHKTGKIRGLLCSSCNRGLGFFRDSADRLRTAAEYLDHVSQ